VVARTEEAAQALEDEFAGLLVEGRALRRALSGS
jgi:transcriptional regulator of arginine metabolism